MKFNSILIALLFCFQLQAQHKKLDYLVGQNLEKAIDFAKEQGKSSLLYFNSLDCHKCEQFTDSVMSEDSLIKSLKSKFIMLNINLQEDEGKLIIKRFKIFDFPAIILLTPDQKLSYTVKLKMDWKNITSQCLSFLNVSGFRDQVLLLQKTNKLDWDQACIELAKSYGKRDYKKYPTADPIERYHDRLLDMDIFKVCKDAYLESWNTERLKDLKKKKQ
jgi:hypothetical protein